MRKTSFLLILMVISIISFPSCELKKMERSDNESEIADQDYFLDDTEYDLDYDSDDEPDFFDDEETDLDSDLDSCTCDTVDGDEDEDGIPNIIETCKDDDGDGIPNCMDIDSDGDGIKDSIECPSQPCVDTDGDGTPNYLDLDSDKDHLSDKNEFDFGTDPYNKDSDGDGTSDGIEIIVTGTDPMDSKSKPSDGVYYVFYDEKFILSYTTLDYSSLDAAVLIDTSTSMEYPIEKVKKEVSEVINEDIPLILDEESSFFSGIIEIPYNPVQPVTSDLSIFNNAMSEIASPGADYEITLETIYQSIAGNGFTSELGVYFAGQVRSTDEIVLPAKDCDGYSGNIGGACLRENATHLFILVTDEKVAEIPYESEAQKISDYIGEVWTKYSCPGHNMDETIGLMSYYGVKIIGVNTGFDCDNKGENCVINNDADESLDYIAKMSGTTDTEGNAYNFHTTDRDGNGIRENLKKAIESLLQYSEKDITLEFEGNECGDGNTTDFVKSFKTVSAVPSENISEKDDSTFYGVKSGTTVSFELAMQFFGCYVGSIGLNEQEFKVKIMNGSQILGTRLVKVYYWIEE